MRLPREASKVSFLGSLLLTVVAAALIVTAVTLVTTIAAGLVGEAGKQLVDQTLQHNGRLGLLDPAAVLEIRVRATRAETDVFPPQQPLGLDAGKAVIRNLVVLLVDPRRHYRLERLR